jgi:hypothetical protein
MTNRERRLRKLETRQVLGGGIVIEIEYVNEPPKSCLDHSEEPLSPRPSGLGPLVTRVYLSEDDRNL